MAPRDRITFGLLQLEDRCTPAILYPNAPYMPGQIVAGFQPGQEASSLQSLRDSGMVARADVLGFGAYRLVLAPGVSVPAAIAALDVRPGVRYAEPDYLRFRTATPNDPSFMDGTLWAHRNTGQNGGTAGADIKAVNGWDLGTGTGETIVAVLDDGVDYTHPDLAANMWTNPGEIPGNGVDDDGNGLVDDVFGANFATSATGTGDPMPVAGDDHGTHVAGTIGAVGNNGIGVTGVAWRTRIMALNFLGQGSQQGSISAEVLAINYGLSKGAKVFNGSFGGPGTNQAEIDAFAAIQAAGAIAVVAAGNDSVDNDVTPSFPANFSTQFNRVITIASVDRNDNMSGFSNFGRQSVTMAAPGSDIFSTIRGGGFASQNGTSMATPQVAGAIVAFWDSNPQLTSLEVVQALRQSVRRIPALTDQVATDGTLDFAALMQRGGRGLYATGADAGGGPHVKVFRGFGSEVGGFMAYDARFTGGVRVAVGDVNGDGITDIITGAGPGGGPHLRVFNSKNFQELFGLFAFEAGFTGGITVATGDVNGDGRADIIVGADRGGGPRVTVFSLPVGATALVRIADFFAYDPAFRGGVNVAAGVFTAGGKQADVVTAPGRGGGPHVKRFSAASVTAGRPAVVGQAMVGDPANRSGLFVTTGDVNGDGVADIITGTAAGTPNVAITNGANMAPLSGMRSPFGGELPGLLNPADPLFVGSAYSPLLNNGLIAPGTPPNQLVSDAAIANAGSRAGYVYGVRVAAVDLNGDNRPEILVSGGPNDNAHVGIISGATLLPTAYFPAYVSSFFGGVFVGA
jgi:subtilisin family serine protease